MRQNWGRHMRVKASVVRRTLICGVLALFATGCGGGGASAVKYSPSTDSARKALEAALDAWKRGEPPAKITSMSPSVEVADSKRQAGQTLASYAIVSETADDAAKRFTVRLKLENPNQERETHYMVVGIDPIWVFGEEDYVQSKGM